MEFKKLFFTAILLAGLSLIGCKKIFEDSSSETSVKPSSSETTSESSSKPSSESHSEVTPESSSESSSQASLFVSVCEYPDSLRKRFEEIFQKPCADIQNEDLSMVKSLNLSSETELENFQSEHFADLAQLKSISFEGNRQVSQIPNFVYSLENLEELNISNTSIENFEEKICQLKNLKILIARDNRYKNNEIPFHTFCLTNLKTIDFSNSHIQYIDEYIYYLSRLENLILEDNELYNAPFVLPYMDSIQYVSFNNNKFKANRLNRSKDCRGSRWCNPVEDYRCHTNHRIIIDRGYPYRRYKSMTDEEFLAREEQGAWMEDICYPNWLYLHGGFENFNTTSGFTEEGRYKGLNTRNSHLLSRTINSKTIREWRLAQMVYARDIFGDLADRDDFEVYESVMFNGLKLIDLVKFKGCKFFGAEAEYWDPELHEIFPEKEKYQKRFEKKGGFTAIFSKWTYIPSDYIEDFSCRSEYDEWSFEPGFEWTSFENGDN